MQTYSHLILTAALGKPLEAWRAKHAAHLPPLRSGAFLFGSVLPDLLLTLISVVAIARDLALGVFNDPQFAQTAPGAPTPPELLQRSMTMQLFDVWFFENPWVIAAHNLFHSPLLISAYLLLGYWLWKRGARHGDWIFWLAAACMLHTLIDIPLHVTDGPLVFFPFNWEYRYFAPISYWDPNYYGREWSIFEHLLDLILLIVLIMRNREAIGGWLRRPRLRRAA